MEIIQNLLCCGYSGAVAGCCFIRRCQLERCWTSTTASGYYSCRQYIGRTDLKTADGRGGDKKKTCYCFHHHWANTFTVNGNATSYQRHMLRFESLERRFILYNTNSDVEVLGSFQNLRTAYAAYYFLEKRLPMQ